MRKTISIIMAIMFVLGTVSFSFADTGQSDVVNNETTKSINETTSVVEDGSVDTGAETTGIKAPITRKWTIQSTERVGYANISAKTFYDKDSANAAGERFTYEVTKTRSGSISGELKVSYATLEAKLGFDYSEKTTLSKSKTTKALAKGEVVKVYYQTRDHKYKVVQKGTRTGLEPIYRTLYVYKPAQPKIIFEYSK